MLTIGEFDKMNKKYCFRILSFFALGLILFSGCGSSGAGEINRLITQGLKDNEGISSSEWKGIMDVAGNMENPLSATEVMDMIKDRGNKMCQARRDPIDCDFPIEGSADNGSTNTPKSPSHFSIYLENSGSMFGYMKGNSDFKNALMALWTNINRHGEKIDIQFINDKVYPVKEELDEFIKLLEPNKLRSGDFGKTGSSKISQILQTVVDSLGHDDEVAVILSDFIFSLEKGGDIEGQLPTQRYGVTNIINNSRLVEKGYAFLVLKFESEFDGGYYNVDNDRIQYKGKRPYYVIVTGKTEALMQFVKRYDVEEYRGFETYALIYNNSSLDKVPYYSILETYRNGRFRTKERTGPSKGIEKVQYNTRDGKIFEFAITADLSKLGLSDDYLLDKANYAVKSSKDDVFNVFEVIPINKGELTSTDAREHAGEGTHVIKIQSESITSGSQNLDIQLLRQLPSWVRESSTSDDRGVKPGQEYDKTFGFEYLVEGISDSYKPLDESDDIYCDFTISLER